MDNSFKYFVIDVRILKGGLSGNILLVHKYILILKFKLISRKFISFPTTVFSVFGIPNESFIRRNYMKAARFRQNIETELQNKKK